MRHKQRKHALLSASASARWLACAPSARLEQRFPDKVSEYAREGTLAHEYSEVLISYALSHISADELENKIRSISKDPLYSQEIEEHAPAYINYVVDRYIEESLEKDTAIALEARVNFSEYVPEGFGTGDAVIVNEDLIEVIDLKFGRGTPVSAQNNSQGKLYALGALMKFKTRYNPARIKITIVQPRRANFSTWEIETKEILTWAETELKPAAAKAFRGEGKKVAGPHCKFCKAKHVCPAFRDKALEQLRLDFTAQDLLTAEQIAEAYRSAELLADYLSSVKTYMYEQALQGRRFPGLKLVEAQGKSRWLHPDQASEVLRKEGYKTNETHNVKVKAISDIKKLLGRERFNDLLGDTIGRTSSIVLADETDERPEYSDIKKDFQ